MELSSRSGHSGRQGRNIQLPWWWLKVLRRRCVSLKGLKASRSTCESDWPTRTLERLPPLEERSSSTGSGHWGVRRLDGGSQPACTGRGRLYIAVEPTESVGSARRGRRDAPKRRGKGTKQPNGNACHSAGNEAWDAARAAGARVSTEAGPRLHVPASSPAGRANQPTGRGKPETPSNRRQRNGLEPRRHLRHASLLPSQSSIPPSSVSTPANSKPVALTAWTTTAAARRVRRHRLGRPCRAAETSRSHRVRVPTLPSAVPSAPTRAPPSGRTSAETARLSRPRTAAGSSAAR